MPSDQSTRLLAATVENAWDAAKGNDLSPLDALVYRSNLLGADRRVANFGGGNTSTKVIEPDHTGTPVEVLYVKGSGTDLATITAKGFTGYRQAEVLPLLARDGMTDADMVAYLARCQVAPDMPRGSIETLLHAFIPASCVDHTHPDAVNMICCAEDGERLARECYGDDAIWIPYIRPGFSLAKQVGEAVRQRPDAKLVLLAKHGLVTWGDDAESSYASTVDAINRAVAFVNDRAGEVNPFGEDEVSALDASERDDLLVQVLPVLRGAVSTEYPKILTVDTSDSVMAFVRGNRSAALSQVGAACPDHLVHTKMKPLWVPFNPKNESADDLEARIREEVARYRDEYSAYYERQSAGHQPPDGGEPISFDMDDPSPRVVLIQGVGMVGVGRNRKAANLSRDLYHRAIAVMGGASALGGFVSLTETESFAVEYWPLERYKLSLAPALRELEGRVAFVTGGAGGIGSATCEALAEDGACIVVADIDAVGAEETAATYGDKGLGVAVDVTSEDAVQDAYRRAVLAFGGVDIVVSNAGLASSASIEETSVELWDKNHAVLVKGYFLVSRAAFRLWDRQEMGGNLIFIASKNAVAAGKNAAAYSSAKAAELHLARCLAEEGGARGIRVNTVNPDAVLQGSRIWGSSWREERAAAYGIDPNDLEAHYRARTTLKVNILPSDIAEAVRFFASPRSSKSTGNMLNVDGGVAISYSR
jgi:rhamnulose-1-phosphate aldolase/alcohol dehydrogenase